MTSAHEFQERVTQVIDGDTFKTSTNRVVRLANVDAPPATTPAGAAATKTLRDLIEGQLVRIKSVATDTYGRTVADVWVGNVWVNATVRMRVGR